MGSLALTWTQPDVARQQVIELRRQTKNKFFINFVMGFPQQSIEATLEAVLEAGAPAITFSWGQPDKLVEKVHRYDALVGVQVGTAMGAQRAVDGGADFIICQGAEAGGHVQSSTLLLDLLPSVVEVTGSVPVVAAGGLSNGSDLAWALQRGASAVMLGTRFVATVESLAHADYKKALVNSRSVDSVYTQCFNRLWPNASHRVLRNKTLDNWEAAGCPQPGMRPGEEEVIANEGTDDAIVRYDDLPPDESTKGKILECCLYAGTGCDKIDDIPHAAELITNIWSEYQAVSGDQH